jgi:hypothetical protein
MDDVALRPCPLCGSTPWPGTSSSWGTATAACSGQDCALVGVAVAADEWNARPIEDALRAEVAAAKARGRAAERAEIVALIRERAELRRMQVEQARAGLGDWPAVDIKAGECEAIADGIERRGGGAA